MTGEKEEQKPVNEPGKEAYVSRVEALATRLMTATKQGDDAAFDELTKTLRGRAYSVAQSLVGSRDDAMELTQEAFLKTYRARDSYREGEPFLPWFHRILRNTCFSFLRKHRRVKKYSMSGAPEEDQGDWEFAGDEPMPSSGVESSEAVTVFRAAFDRLPERDREILNLRHFEELTYREIARTLEIPEGTVMSRLFHARRRLRELLTPHLEGALEDFAPAFPDAERD